MPDKYNVFNFNSFWCATKRHRI